MNRIEQYINNNLALDKTHKDAMRVTLPDLFLELYDKIMESQTNAGTSYALVSSAQIQEAFTDFGIVLPKKEK